MKSRVLISASLLLVPCAVLSSPECAPHATPVLKTVRELREAGFAKPETEHRFSVTGTVLTTMGQRRLVVEDTSGRTAFYAQEKPLLRLSAGDRISVNGLVRTGYLSDLYSDILMPKMTITVLGHGPGVVFRERTIAELTRSNEDFLPVRVTGTVIDIFRDEIDEESAFLQLRDGTAFLSVGLPASHPLLTRPDKLLYASVLIEGFFVHNLTGYRVFLGPHLALGDTGSLRIVAPPAAKPTDAPTLQPLMTTDPRTLAAKPRGSLVGTVLAVRPNGRLILQSSKERLSNIFLANGVAPPVRGQRIRASGHPTTDLYHLNLTQAFWCDESNGMNFAETNSASAVSPRSILHSGASGRRYRPEYHGRRVTMTGVIRTTATSTDLVSDGLPVPLELASGLPLPVAGSIVRLTGVWAFNIDNWRPDAILPHITGYALVLHDPNDIVVISAPPWWTPFRLMLVIIALTALLIAFVAWNRILKTLIDRRGRALYRESIARATSELKTSERTRLAVELHDALSQTLAGVSFRIDAAEETLPTDPDEAARQLKTARLTLKSCRDDLRNCLWDLRNDTLECRDVSESIRRTVLPHLGRTELTVRFPIPRARLSDSTLHALLSIIRELSVNAVRHGRARHISVAGSLDERELAFSVKDDGVGFDPSNRPGAADGHFGLQGVMERLRQMNATLTVESKPGSGTKIIGRIPK